MWYDRIFKFLGPIAIPIDLYDAFSDEPNTVPGYMHGAADFLATAGLGSGGALAGSIIGSALPLGPAGAPIGFLVGGHIGAEYGPELLEFVMLVSFGSIFHQYDLSQYGPSGPPDLTQVGKKKGNGKTPTAHPGDDPGARPGAGFGGEITEEEIEDQLEDIEAVGSPATQSGSIILRCPLGEVMVNGRCEPIN
ncbi:MAG TPA: hypothetical protein EYO33_32495 [Phycisphaerales bacterium]|nr:hypothetical protein [Phycisphaerales bacterium]